MNTYLTMMVTILVVTQIIRITQNTINLHRQNVEFKRNCEWVKDANITKRDFETQRENFYLLNEWLKKQRTNND